MTAITTDCTQILHIPFHASIPIPKGGGTEKLLQSAFDIPKKSRGFKRLYWGKRLEDQILQVHIGKSFLLTLTEEEGGKNQMLRIMV